MAENNHPATALTKRIQSASAQLGKSSRSVAEMILARPEDVALSTAAAVAAHLGVSESTVVRFATAMGFDGYPELRRALQAQIREQINPAKRLDQYAVQQLHRKEPLPSFQSDFEDVAATERALVPADLDAAVRLISSAREVHVLGLRGSFGLAYMLHHPLSQVLPSLRLMDFRAGLPVESLPNMSRRDLLLAISFPRYTQATLHLVDLAARRGVPIIAITDGPLSPVARHATVTLTAHVSQRAFANSNIGALALINALVGEVAVRNRRQSSKMLAQLDDALREADVLYHPPAEPREAMKSGSPRRKPTVSRRQGASPSQRSMSPSRPAGAIESKSEGLPAQVNGAAALE